MRVRVERADLAKRLAPLAIMPAAAFGVHQLRYWLAFGSGASAQLEAQGHAYLRSAAPWLVLLIAIAAGAFLRALGRAFAGQRSLSRYTVSFVALWLTCAACLLTIYVAQELLEGLLATGHPGGLTGFFGYGGWWSIPAALAVGLVLATLFHGARWALDEVVRRYGRHVRVAAPRPATPRATGTVVLPRLAPLALGWSGRGPPR